MGYITVCAGPVKPINNDYTIKIDGYAVSNPRLFGNEILIDVMPKWISVKNRLPNLDQVVIVFHDPYIGIEQRTDPKDGNIWAGTEKKYITHWMPLPTKPEV